MSYIKCIAVLVSNCYSSEIVDERNFGIGDNQGIQNFYKKYSDEKYRCFQIPLD